MEPTKLAPLHTSYRFSFGDSSLGPIGFVLAFCARDLSDAIKIVQGFREYAVPLPPLFRSPLAYARVYVGSEWFTERAITDALEEEVPCRCAFAAEPTIT